MILTPLLLLAVQVAPNAAGYPEPIPDELREQRRLEREKADLASVWHEDRLAACFDLTQTNAVRAVMVAQEWAAEAAGENLANALHCKGVAQMELGRGADAAASFRQSLNAQKNDDAVQVARLNAMAGTAHLIDGDAVQAIPLLNTAKAAAEREDLTGLSGRIDLERARAFVAMGEDGKAKAALESARRLIPDDPQAWLLSATLARRADRYATAQPFIERARSLDPDDPQILLEFGVIAFVLGDTDQALADWQRILTMPDAAEEQERARFYLEQAQTP